VTARGAALVGLALAGGCGSPAPIDAAPGPADPRAEITAAIERYEDELRAEIDPRAAASSRAGVDPFAITAIGPDRALGLLRGVDAVVLLDGQGRELDRAAAPGEPVAIAAGPPGQWLVVGERPDARVGDVPGATLGRVQVRGDRIALEGRRVPGVLGLRDVVFGPPGVVHLADRRGGRILVGSTECASGQQRCDETLAVAELARCEGAIDLARDGELLVAACLLERSIWIGRLAPNGRSLVAQARIVRRGPAWAVDVAARPGGGWVVAAAGVEDHPLDRSDGSFGYVDPFVFVDDVRPCEAGLCVGSRAAVNVGEHALVMPKWIAVTSASDRTIVEVSGYGAETFVTLSWPADGAAPLVERIAVPPGLREVATVGARRLAADPLLDRWVVLDERGATLVAPPGPPDDRSPAERVGEALVFTHLLAPGASSEGHRSRFTCETCHFEGTVDGRVHFTGRGDVHATTKPILGLFPNRPHFTRALDRTLATMVDNEFAVANRGSTLGADFSIDPGERPWLAALGVDAPMGPIDLRRAMMRFFAGFDPPPNAATIDRESFSAAERRGAALFREHCESCHAARLVADDPGSVVPFDRWESLVLHGGAIVWASEQRVKTGIEPYVHDEGARPPSLRRLWAKRPYFTNGSAATIADVLARARVPLAGDPDGFLHHGPATATTRTLDDAERAALAAFLDLL